MRSQLAERLGVLTPQIVRLPPDVASLAAAEEVIELADAYGVADGFPLDESQKFTLRAALGERVDGSWAATTIGDFEPRQSGKNDAVAARELAGLLLFGEKLIIHTAHEFPTANESFLRLANLFENRDDLHRLVRRIFYGNGTQGITLKSGQRLLYKARTGGSGRGFAKADLVVYDEAQHLRQEHVAASGPARLVNPNSQAWYCGSGGLATSVNAWRMRRRALTGEGSPRFAYVEHTAEKLSMVNGRIVSERPDDVLDRDAWALAHPAYGHRITDEALLGLYDELGPEDFARECLCVWDPDPNNGAGSVIDMDRWHGLTDTESKIAGPVSWALDISPERSWSSFAAAGRRDDGIVHVGVVRREPGTGWVIAEAVELSARFGSPLRIDPASPAGAMISTLRERGVDVYEVPLREYVQACGAFVDHVENDLLRHPHQPTNLDVALLSAVKRNVSEAWAWSRSNSATDISPLVAVTLALGGVPGADQPYDTMESVR